MVVRIRLSSGRKLQRKQRKNQRLALAVASLLTPGAVMACVLGVWGLAADLNVTTQFPIGNGLYSHWQVWLAIAALLQSCAHVLNRYGNPPEAVLPESAAEAEHKLANSRY